MSFLLFVVESSFFFLVFLQLLTHFKMMKLRICKQVFEQTSIDTVFFGFQCMPKQKRKGVSNILKPQQVVSAFLARGVLVTFFLSV